MRIKLHRFVNDMPLMRKMTLLFLAIVLVPCMALGLITYRYNCETALYKQVDNSTKTLRSVSAHIVNNFSNVERCMQMLAHSDDVRRFLTAEEMGDILVMERMLTRGSIANMSFYMSALEVQTTIYATNTAIYEMYYSLLHESRLEPYIDFQTYGWGSVRRHVPESIQSPYDVNRLVFPYYQEVATLSGRHIGTIMAGIPIEVVLAPFLSLADDHSITVMQGDVLLFGDPGLLPDHAMTVSEILLSQDILLMIQINAAEVYQMAVHATIPLLVAVLLSGVTVMALTQLILRRILARLRETSRAMEAVGRHQANIQLPPEGDDEIGQLIGAFNVLLARLEEHHRHAVEWEKSKRKAQTLALQYQMNPHFLFNALISVQILLEAKKEYAVSDAISRLGDILRYNLSESHYATLAQEVAHLNAYIGFANFSKEDRIRMILSWPESLADWPILRFTFQPLLENAIRHGLPQKGLLNIYISIQADGDRLVLTVENDGHPIPPDRLDELRAYMHSPSFDANKGIGLVNLARRIHLVYGQDASLHVESTDVRTCVTICLPILSGGDLA